MLDCLNRKGVAKIGNFGGKLPRLQKLQGGVLTGSATIQHATDSVTAATQQRRNTNDTAVLQYESGGRTPITVVYWPLSRSKPYTISQLLPLKKLVVLARTRPHKSVGMTGNSPTLPFSRTKWADSLLSRAFPTFSPPSPIYASTAPLLSTLSTAK